MSQEKESTNENSKKKERRSWESRSALEKEQSVLRSAQGLFAKLESPAAKVRVLGYLRDQFAEEQSANERKQYAEMLEKEKVARGQAGYHAGVPGNAFADMVARS